jgi:hypothetical protein
MYRYIANNISDFFIKKKLYYIYNQYNIQEYIFSIYNYTQ